ncbi:MAG: CHC2 zinc finger domain-containing protein [Candidatus Gracilibacteria bacterium]
MKQSITELEKKYFENYTYGNNYPNSNIERKILESFSKKTLSSLKNDTEREYFELKSIYLKDLRKIQQKDNYLNGSELEKYFLEQFFYYFEGGYELKKTLDFIEKVESFYIWNHTSVKDKKSKYIDFKTIPIVPFISKFVKIPGNLKNNFICIFPDHKDKTASFHIYEKTNTFKCFGCGKSGGAVNFIEGYYGIENNKACKKILSLYNK